MFPRANTVPAYAGTHTHADLFSPHTKRAVVDTEPAGAAEGPSALRDISAAVAAAFDCADDGRLVPEGNVSPRATDWSSADDSRDDEELAQVLQIGGLQAAAAAECIEEARRNGRDSEWIRCWWRYANDHAQNPAGYTYRQFMANKELPPAARAPAKAAAAADMERDLISDLRAAGLTEFDGKQFIADYGGPRVKEVLDTAAATGKAKGWIVAALQGGWEMAGRVVKKPERADDGDPYNRRVSPERQAAIDARAAEGYQKTRREIEDRMDGHYPTDEEMETSGFNAMREKLRKQIASGAHDTSRGPRVKTMTEAEKARVKAAEAELREHNEKRRAEPPVLDL